MSHEHFRNYLSTGDLSENERSLELLSESLRFEMEAFSVFRSVDSDTPTDFYLLDQAYQCRYIIVKA